MSDLEYQKALKMGEKAYKEAVSKGESPYLPVLDDLLKQVSVKSEENLGLVDIPLHLIVGTRTAGRANAFARNFMPLMKEGTEFAYKWSNVYNYQMKEGVNDPVVAYEYMNRFYILEGNKRVSVLKYLNAFSIEGNVTRIVPERSEDPQILLLYEFMRFYSLTGINYLDFRKPGSFDKLLHFCGKGNDEIWSEEERSDFSSCYIRFSGVFSDKGGGKLGISPAEALLLYLQVYPYAKMPGKSEQELKKELAKLWDEFPVIREDEENSLVLEPGDVANASVLARVKERTGKAQLKAAFIHDKAVEWSGWTYGHELGRMYLEQKLGSQIRTSVYVSSNPDSDRTDLLEQAVEEGNQILFTTSERYLDASLKAALKHPSVRILNCSVNHSFRAIRTYYGRMYEVKYLEGMIAGAMCENGRIAYVAEYPIYGELANINAFALGASAMRPDSKVYLVWLGQEGTDLNELCRREDIRIVSDIDMIRPGMEEHTFGLYQLKDGRRIPLAAPLWNWGPFYEKIVRDIAKGSYRAETAKDAKSTNYWWGIASGIVDIVLSRNIPDGLRGMVECIRSSICEERYLPFFGLIKRADGKTAGTAGEAFSPSEIITMDWLAWNVIGQIPKIDTLTDEGKSLVEIQGVDTARKALGDES